MGTDVLVLNGGSSSAKSGIVRCLQAVLADPWLAIGVDTLVDALPPSMQATDAGIGFGADGGVNIGPMFRKVETAWMQGVAATARAGAHVIVDDVFLADRCAAKSAIASRSTPPPAGGPSVRVRPAGNSSR